MEAIVETSEARVTERNLLFFFLQKKALNFSGSPLLSHYFNGFEADWRFMAEFEQKNICTIKDVERELEVMIPENDRKINGAFFTPSYVVDFIIQELALCDSDRIIDLSCGCGAFLIGLLDYFKQNSNKPLRQILRENVFGADILPYNVERTKVLLSIYALQAGEIVHEDDLNIHQVDSLRNEWKEQYDFIVGNPPYVKFQDLSDENRVFLAKEWRTFLYGHHVLEKIQARRHSV